MEKQTNMRNIVKKSIPIKDLIFWSDNPRFSDKDFKGNQPDILNYLVSTEHYKVQELAQRIADEIDVPPLENLVVYFNKGKNIVYEGNRRLAAYKALENPLLIKDNTVIQSKFIKIRERIDNTITISDIKIDCLMMSNEDFALDYVKRKHNSPNDPVYERSWGDLERATFRVNYGTPTKEDWLKYKVAGRIRELNLPNGLADKVLGPGFVSVLFRTINGKVAERLNITYEDKNLKLPDSHAFNIILGIIVMSIIRQEKFNDKPFSQLSTEEYINYINDNLLKNESVSFDEWVNNIPSQSEVSEQDKPKRSRRKAEKLIPDECDIYISNPRASAIFRELKHNLVFDDLSAKSVPNAVAVLFRVFLEISLREYGEVNKLKFGKKASVKEMIEKSVNQLKKINSDDDRLKDIEKVAWDAPAESVLSIQTFYEIAHSKDIGSNVEDIKIKWASVQSFFEVLWQEINKKKR